MRCLDDRSAWLALAAATGIGPRTSGALVRAFGSPSRAASCSEERLARVPGVGPVRAQALIEALREARPDAMDEEARRAGLALLTPADAAYPGRVLSSPDPPPALWVRGRLPDAATPSLAIVGTRGASPSGLRFSRSLAEALARAGCAIVSGLARGIDAAAHAGALAGGGETVAVLGSGADVVYPPEHGRLAEEIVARGAIVSEHPPGTPPHPGHFPRRNRIVAALGTVLVVVEAPAESGALGTARLALELGREVLAVPGPVERGLHAGCHRLLRDGARLCEGPDDVLEALGLGRSDGLSLRARAPVRPPPAGPALALWSALEPDDVLDADQLARRTGLSADAVAAGLTTLELDGFVVRVPGVGVRRTD